MKSQVIEIQRLSRQIDRVMRDLPIDNRVAIESLKDAVAKLNIAAERLQRGL